MKTFLKITFWAVSLTASFSFIQKTPFNLSMQAPEKWIKNSNEEVWDNLFRFKHTEAELNKYISDHKGSALLLSYMKYNPANHAGLIPIIQFNLRNNSAKKFSQFTTVMARSAETMKKYLHNFKYIDSAKVTTLANRECFYFSATFNMLTKNRDTLKSRSKTFAVPFGDKFLQINFTDGQSEDCSILYDSLIKTIKFD
jgi:hypothetical protein